MTASTARVRRAAAGLKGRGGVVRERDMIGMLPWRR
jgi:hypothetical protein